MLVIVPDSLRKEINRALDKAYRLAPEAECDRETHYMLLLNFFNEHGRIPDFTFHKAEGKQP